MIDLLSKHFDEIKSNKKTLFKSVSSSLEIRAEGKRGGENKEGKGLVGKRERQDRSGGSEKDDPKMSVEKSTGCKLHYFLEPLSRAYIPLLCVRN